MPEAAVLQLDPHRARLQRCQQRGMAVDNTQIAQRAVCDNHLGKTREDRLFGADDVAMNGHGHNFASRCCTTTSTDDTGGTTANFAAVRRTLR